jgi:tRNA(Arg) A34 adenosine deaminase TadA
MWKLLKRFGGIFQLAKKLAGNSTYGNFRHGAVLVRGGAIVGLGINSEKYCSVGRNYRPEEKGNATYHAEIKALLNIPRHISKGAVMYVARCSKNGEDDRMSKPCTMCHAVMEERGIRKVYYTVDNEVVGTYKF